MTIWRLVKARYRDVAFTGEGARIAGGRWNRPGTSVAYASESRALALLELLAGDDQEIILSVDHVVFSVEYADDHVEIPQELPPDWDAPGWPTASQAFGTAWQVERRSVVLRVPSVIVPGEFNHVINPEHPQFCELRIGTAQNFPVNRRLL